MFKFCPQCAHPLEQFQDGNNARMRCPACGWIQYRNPTVGVAVILMENGRLLLGERRSGGWCIPCGHVEWDEDIELAAVREFAEETGLKVALERVYAVKSNFHDPNQHTVGVWYWAHRIGGILRPQDDLVQVDFFLLDGLPSLAFPTDGEIITQLCESSQ